MSDENGISTAAQWEERALDVRAKTAEPVELPSGVTVLLAPPPLELWWGSEMMPQTLTADVQKVFGDTEGDADRVEQAFEEIGEERSGKVFAFMRNVVQATCIEPRIVETTIATNQIAVHKVPMGDFAFIYAWGMGQHNNRMVKTKGGAVSVESLRNFRGKRKLPRSSKNGRKVSSKPK